MATAKVVDKPNVELMLSWKEAVDLRRAIEQQPYDINTPDILRALRNVVAPRED